MSAVNARSSLADYGLDVTSTKGARRHLRLVRPPRDIDSPAAYVRVCRRLEHLGPLTLRGGDAIDHRLIELGWNVVPPSQWVAEGLPAFVAYWSEAAPRPTRVGSSRNPSTGAAYIAWRAGIPAVTLTAIRQNDEWLSPTLRGVVAPRATRIPRRRFQRIMRAARALRRKSARREPQSGRRWEPWGNLKFWATLGRLSPELQAVALATLPEQQPRWAVDSRFGRPYAPRDIDWGAVSDAQRRLKRQDALIEGNGEKSCGASAV